MSEQLSVPVALDRIADAADYAVVGPHDGRRQVVNTRVFPYAAVCQVERDFGDGRWSGCSGFLISPRIVVTAGHCVFNRIRRLAGQSGSPARIRISPGRFAEQGRTPFGQYQGLRWFAHRNFFSRGNRAFDIGVVVLERPVVGMPAYFTLWTPTDADLARVRQSRLLHISGYPGDKPRGTQWEHEERLDRKEPRQLFYSVDTCPGHSGAPVWVERIRGGRRQVVAIHVAGPTPHPEGAWGCRPGVPLAPAGHFNRGVRMTPAVGSAIRAMGQGRTNAQMIEISALRKS